MQTKSSLMHKQSTEEDKIINIQGTKDSFSSKQ